MLHKSSLFEFTLLVAAWSMPIVCGRASFHTFVSPVRLRVQIVRPTPNQVYLALLFLFRFRMEIGGKTYESGECLCRNEYEEL